MSTGTLAFSGASTTLFGAMGGGGTLLDEGNTYIQSGVSATVADWTEEGSATTLFLETSLSYGGVFDEMAGSSISVDPGDTLTLTGTGDTIAGAVSGPGTLALAGGGSTTIASTASLKISHWSVSGTGTSVTLVSPTNYSGAFSLGTGATVALSGGYFFFSGAGALTGGTIDGSGSFDDAGATSVENLTIGGTVTWVNTSTITQNGGNVTIGDGSGHVAELSNKSGAIYDITDNSSIAQGTSSASSLVNAGLFEKTVGAGTSTISLAVANSGTLEAAAGTLDFADAVTGTGSETIAGAATLEFGSTVASGQTISFTGGGETLDLGAPTGFSGAVSGFDAIGTTDAIDLLGANWSIVGYSPNAGNTQGTLTLNNGTNNAQIVFDGSYTLNNFGHAVSGGNTVITYA